MKTRVAVIGAGNMGLHHVRNYYYQPNVDLIGVVDQNVLRLNQVIAKYPIKGFSDYKDLLPLVDAVSIATPTSTHYAIACDFLSHGKHVLLEKPITQEIEQAKKLIEVAENNHSILAIGHIERFNPVMLELENVLRNQKPVFIDIHRESPFDPRIFDADVVLDLMIHDIDLIFFLLKENIKLISVYGISVHSDKNDLVNAQFLSESGILINVTTSRATEQKIRQWRLVLPNQMIEADLLERKLHITRRTLMETAFYEDRPDIKYKQEQLTEKVLVANFEPLQMELNDFIQAVQTGIAPKVGGQEGLKALEIIKEIETKIRNRASTNNTRQEIK
ncbi:Gfo/Idh/MocA family protein [Paenibacillus ehimensis]|uniref:Gfo/Idh/MocA family oxidoreductase n=1 Tax=Paenibacillus ehimensis TaxID=79264 RepID=A0ABT8VCW6_9BACL|nr:Gfo/Idh/MocA family oxidoreductase [Paenibacillus ehimensis]MDO3678805.1 Gfo/Idh/MocA family oxidoreductase [Paenibacillus ehimensis]MEC0209448.1 Gfo/Idh/MocA family oxidoreductase [Paenibacillus ehimensis]